MISSWLLIPLIAQAITNEDAQAMGLLPQTQIEDIALVPNSTIGHETSKKETVKNVEHPATAKATQPGSRAATCGMNRGEWPEIKKLVEAEFGSKSPMVGIGFAESHFDPSAWNCNSSAKGIFEILDGTWNHFKCVGNPFHALDNIACARKIYDANGTRDWNASKHVWGKYGTL